MFKKYHDKNKNRLTSSLHNYLMKSDFVRFWLVILLFLGAVGFFSLILAVSPVTDTFTDETKIATSTNITVGGGQVKLSVIPWACGDALVDSRDSKSYSTVSIGTQCWMAENLDYGTRINGAGNQTNNSTVEKYCHSDSDANCTTYGGLYQWDEAMNYSSSCNGSGEGSEACASPVQGLCPESWHIPSHYEYVALERAVCTSGTCASDFPYDTSTTGWRGTNEGTSLKQSGASGFEGLLAGYRATSGSFGDLGAYGYFWSSLESGSTAWRRTLGSGDATVNRRADSKAYGFSLRCLKD